jgi:hypothetical protein
MKTLRISGWEKWQSYRRDRGQPPWIKIYRALLRNPEWVTLADAERGQLICIWMLAADHEGVIPASPELIQKLCFMGSTPDLQRFMDLEFIDPGDIVTPERRQGDAPEKRRVEKSRVEKSMPGAVTVTPPRRHLGVTNGHKPVAYFGVELPMKGRADGPHQITLKDLEHWKELYPGADVEAEIRKMAGWLEGNSSKRKTPSGVESFIHRWLAKAQDRSSGPSSKGEGRRARNKQALEDL